MNTKFRFFKLNILLFLLYFVKRLTILQGPSLRHSAKPTQLFVKILKPCCAKPTQLFVKILKPCCVM